MVIDRMIAMSSIMRPGDCGSSGWRCPYHMTMIASIFIIAFIFDQSRAEAPTAESRT
jgi:hypothetical protein